MQMRRKIIIKTGSSLPDIVRERGDFEQWITQAMQTPPGEWEVVNVQAGEQLPAFEHCKAVVITGSPAMVSDRAPWSVATARWLKQAVSLGVPTLGICYGHQLLADALGGEVGYHPAGPEAGIVEIHHQPAAQQDPLFSSLPHSFYAPVIHWQTVLSLPPGAQLLAGNHFEAHHAFRVANAWGVQFHPEFDQYIISRYLDLLGRRLEQAGKDVEALQKQLHHSVDAATQLLNTFNQWSDTFSSEQL